MNKTLHSNDWYFTQYARIFAPHTFSIYCPFDQITPFQQYPCFPFVEYDSPTPYRFSNPQVIPKNIVQNRRLESLRTISGHSNLKFPIEMSINNNKQTFNINPYI